MSMARVARGAAARGSVWLWVVALLALSACNQVGVPVAPGGTLQPPAPGATTAAGGGTASAGAPTLAPDSTDAAEPTDPGEPTDPDEPGEPSEGGSTGGLCGLVSEADIQAAAGATVTTTTAGGEDCTWTLSNLQAINLRVESDTADLSGQKELFPNGKGIPGLGDDSWWSGSSEGIFGNLLYFTRGGRTYAVQLVLFPATGNNEATAVTIAQKALEKL